MLIFEEKDCKMKCRKYLILLAVVLLVCFTFIYPGLAQQTFKEQQMRYQRVRTAYQEKDALLRQLFTMNNLQYPPTRDIHQGF